MKLMLSGVVASHLRGFGVIYRYAAADFGFVSLVIAPHIARVGGEHGMAPLPRPRYTELSQPRVRFVQYVVPAAEKVLRTTWHKLR